MSTITRPRSVADVPVRRLDPLELRRRLGVVEARHKIVGQLLAQWRPHGRDARAQYRALRQERSGLEKRLKAIKHAIREAGGAP